MEETISNVSLCVVAAVCSYCILDRMGSNSSIMGLVSNAWAGLGSAFGPGANVSVLEENDLQTFSCYGFRWIDCYHLGLYSFDGWSRLWERLPS